MRLKNKVAIVTGGNSGIGKGIAQRFVEEGAKVVILGRNKETLEQAKREMDNQVLAIQGDVTNTADLKKLYQQTLDQFGKIDCLVVNSGVAAKLHIKDATEADFDHMVDINYRGAFFTVHHALNFLNPKSSIIMISSCAAAVTFKNHSIYSSTKAALSKLAKNIALDLVDQGIRVNSISPGYVETPIFGKSLKANPNYYKEKEAFVPLKRIGQPQDIAHAALFLASDEASYITGIDLLVDGGYALTSNEG